MILFETKRRGELKLTSFMSSRHNFILIGRHNHIVLIFLVIS